uniref:F-box domain-containing protein n=1 Tax=Oryza rufipogon TaxID=4529 RepID=A0A0E0QED4_ORYRU
MSNKRMRPTVLEASTYDFISSLPDESLQHILCFMTTREAIQTCVLSTRWRHIWKSVQCLEIKASEFTSKMGFVNFMDNLVLRRGCVPLDSLRMYTLYQHGSVSLNHHTANMWVGYALRRNVRELHICEHYSEYFDLDHSSFILSHLKILRLRNVTITLQDLVMIDCCVYATRFSSTSLKNLTFISHSPDNGDSVHDDYKDLVIDTPSLVSLHLECLPFLAPCLVNVSSVAKAYIRLDDMSFPCFDTKYNILSGLSNVTKLKLLNEEYDIEGLAWEQWMSYPQEETPDLSFSCERLKKVKIICVQDDKRVPAIVNAILANANSLPEIVIKPPVNWDPGGPASFSVRLFRLSLSSGSPQAPSRDHLRVDHGVTSASARGSVASVATRDSSAVDVATSYGSPPPPPRATPPVARSYVASPPRAIVHHVFECMSLRLMRMSNKCMRPTALEASTYDFISSLPDELLQHILSFMTAREAVQTCVLSSRWRHIWKSLQCLNIKGSEFTSEAAYVNFMDNLVLRRGCVPLDSLLLCNSYGRVSLNHDRANLWFGYALRSNVREINIQEKHFEYSNLDHSSFISSHLKILCLNYVSISDLFIENLFSGCPALQDLVMVDCCVYATRFSSSSLKNLTFTSHSPDNGDLVHDDFKDLVIDTPSLVSLHLEYLPFLAPCLLNASSVEKAYFRLDDMSFPCFHMKYNILSALSNVKNLKLLIGQFNDDAFQLMQNEVLKRDLWRCRTFNSLKKLSVSDWCVDGELHTLIHLLRCSPILEKLTLHLGVIGGLAWEQWMSYPQSEMPDMSFICEHLKKVKITCANDDKRVPAIVNAILVNANSLPEIVIKPYTRLD